MASTRPGTGNAADYEVLVKGRLDDRWTAWFDGLTVIPRADATTVIRVAGADQAALHGLLRQVRDAGLTLVSVTRVDGVPGPASPEVAR